MDRNEKASNTALPSAASETARAGRRREEMSVPLLTVVFPNGTTEYRTSPHAPTVGEVVRHLGEYLVVHTIGHDLEGNIIVTLRRPAAIDDAAAASG
jgi:hypothetical protein